MFKLSKHLQSRNQLIRRTVVDKYSRERPQFFYNASQAAQDAVSRNFASGPEGAGKVFASYTIYKGKAVLSAEPVLPKFYKLDSGHVKVDRQGVILLTFCPAIGERKYDWEKKKFFALSPTEVGSLISLGAGGSCEFFHDPSMKSSAAGQVRKSLSIKPHADGTGYMVSLNVVDNIEKTSDRFVVPVTAAEFATLRVAASFALPHLLGWDRCILQSTQDVPENQQKMAPRLTDSEWNR
ncbi:DNA metabolism protein [Lithospermum erythrorhizon]|uniref:DNA metabolism protein n=1 Tax=Lithospermum erythrorhizon TaxID=34254 RepID=A0AAV3NIR3_LITER